MKLSLKIIVILLSLTLTLNAYTEETLDEYLSRLGYIVTEGYCTKPQEEQFITALKLRSNQIQKIAEIGFNAGHSADLFLQICPEATLTTFDINQHPYTKIGLEYMKHKYKDRLNFVEGNSIASVPLFASSHPNQTFDLIYIDGDHSFTGCLADIINCRALSHKNTFLWVDDHNFPSIAQAIQECVKLGIIEVLDTHKSYDPKHFWREWIEARYIR